MISVELPIELNITTIPIQIMLMLAKIIVVCIWLKPSVKIRWCMWLRSAENGESPLAIRIINTRSVSNIGPINIAKVIAGAQKI